MNSLIRVPARGARWATLMQVQQQFLLQHKGNNQSIKDGTVQQTKATLLHDMQHANALADAATLLSSALLG